MTTSKAIHNALLALSQKVKKKKQPETKPKNKKLSAQRFVQMAQAVLQAGRHHVLLAAPKPGVNNNSGATTAAAAAAATDTSSTYDDYYPKLQKQLSREIAQMEETRKQVAQKQCELWDVYKYGLLKISNLNDLRDAPDAIMPGNFPPPPKEEETLEDDNKDQNKDQKGDENNNENKKNAPGVKAEETEI